MVYRGLHFWKRYFLARLRINRIWKKVEKKLNSYSHIKRTTELTPVEVGLIPSDIEYKIENPCNDKFVHCDGIHFSGMDCEGNVIDVGINKIESNIASVWIFLKLSNGEIYKLPFHDDARTPYINNEHLFLSSGLQIKCLSPLRKWRISFNGLLLKVTKEQHEKKEYLIHVKFSFIWLAMSVVQELNHEICPQRLAFAFAKASHDASTEDLKCVLGLQNRLEQWGQLMGTMHIKERDEKELYLWTLRTRIFDTPLWNEGVSFAKFYMYFKEGVPVKIETLSIEDVLQNFISGHTVTGLGSVDKILDCDFNLELFRENSPLQEVKFSCTISGQKKELVINFGEQNASFKTGPDLQLEVIVKPFSVVMDKCDMGSGILHLGCRSKQGTDCIFQLPPVLLKETGFMSSEKMIVLLTDDLCKSSAIAGGKGCSLALLNELSTIKPEFVVPKGFVITTAAFESQIKNNEAINCAIQRLNNVSCEKIKLNLKEECSKCVEQFNHVKLSENLKNEIQEVLLKLYGTLEDLRFSIRSSACGEDSEDLSAAGQMLTFLGIRGSEKIFDAVVKCWASKFSYEAVQYARQNGQSLNSPMAVVIQEMVPAEIAGVMFTVDPVTGDPSRPCITANFGLGETVVSSLAEPDTIILTRNMDNSIDVAEKHLGTKTTQVYMNEDGVEKKNLHPNLNECSLTDDLAKRIGNIGILIENCFCGPRDIEWAVHKGKLYLLQARPITTLHTETDFELIHDQDSPVRSEYEYWTRANTGEVFLGATSPLGISLVVHAMDVYGHRSHILRENRHESEFCPYYLHILPVTHRQVTINLVDTVFRSNEEKISNNQKALEVALFGRNIVTEEMHKAGVKKHGYMSRKRKLAGLIFLIQFSFRLPKLIKYFDGKIKKYKLPLETYTTAMKTYEGILEQVFLYSQICSVHGATTFISSVFNLFMMDILAKGRSEWDSDLYSDLAMLLSTCCGVESADVPESLQNLAKTIALNHNTFSSLPETTAYSLLRNDEGDAGKLFNEFLKKHGHRCVKEFDLYSMSWGMKPESLIPILQNLVRSPNILTHQAKEAVPVETIISKIKIPLSYTSKLSLKFQLPRCQNAVRQREKTKSILIKTVDWLRRSCYHLGEKMVEEGMLPDHELIFFLTLEEIKDILDYRKPGLVPKAIRRRRLHPKLDALQFPEIMKGIPHPIQEKEEDFSKYSSFTLKGTPVCQGVVKATARVITSLSEASTIQDGDVLITHATDTGWSPYFPMLSGVVTVLGGLISHGAVVAREYGLPCVVAVQNATTAFKSGDIVILDGNKGTVTKILSDDCDKVSS